MGANPEAYTDHLAPEGRRLGNIFGMLLLLLVTVAGFGVVLITLGEMQLVPERVTPGSRKRQFK